MPIAGASRRERWLNSLAERASKRGSAASRGEVSLLAGAGIVVWALLTITVLISDPQALPLAARDTQLTVAVSGGVGRDTAPVSDELPEPALPSIVAAVDTATPAPSPSPVATQTPPGRSPSPTPTARAATPAPVTAAGPPPVPATVASPPPATPPPTAAPTSTPAATPPSTPTATPAQTPPAVQVVGSGGAVITGPRGGPLNTRGVDLYNCNDFANLEQLLAVFLASGPSDPNRLDPHRTGSPCPPEDEESQPTE